MVHLDCKIVQESELLGQQAMPWTALELHRAEPLHQLACAVFGMLHEQPSQRMDLQAAAQQMDMAAERLACSEQREEAAAAVASVKARSAWPRLGLAHADMGLADVSDGSVGHTSSEELYSRPMPAVRGGGSSSSSKGSGWS
jgi:hypothetical protein